MRHLLEQLPGAQLPDTVGQSQAPGLPLAPPDDDDLLRPSGEELLLGASATGAWSGAPSALAKHLLHTFGPLHPALSWPVALRVELDGDRIVSADPEVGFLHQGLEKAGEQIDLRELRGDGALALIRCVARANPLAPLPLQLATVLALEKHLGVAAVPNNATVWRTVALELNRIRGHLSVLIHPALAPDRAPLVRKLTQAARTASGLLDGLLLGDTFCGVGGLRRALDADEARSMLATLKDLRAAVHSVQHDLARDGRAHSRFEGVGRITAVKALAHALTGPAVRACGVADDLRARDRSLSYGALNVVPVVAEGGCTAARLRVLHGELAQSLVLVVRLLAMLDAGPTVAADAATQVSTFRDAEIVVRAQALEAQNGETAVTVCLKGAHLQRVRIRTASLAACAALGTVVSSARMDDAIAIIVSLGIVGSEVDR